MPLHYPATPPFPLRLGQLGRFFEGTALGGLYSALAIRPEAAEGRTEFLVKLGNVR